MIPLCLRVSGAIPNLFNWPCRFVSGGPKVWSFEVRWLEALEVPKGWTNLSWDTKMAVGQNLRYLFGGEKALPS